MSFNLNATIQFLPQMRVR